jgi:hypothetical protein
MATSLLTVLGNVPWSEVLRHAPKVAEGARKLWQRVRGGLPATPEPATTAAAPAPAADEALNELQARLTAMQAAVVDLQSQMADSSALIQQLAELNNQLIQHVQAQDRRLRWMAVALAVLAAAALVALALYLRAPG